MLGLSAGAVPVRAMSPSNGGVLDVFSVADQTSAGSQTSQEQSLENSTQNSVESSTESTTDASSEATSDNSSAATSDTTSADRERDDDELTDAQKTTIVLAFTSSSLAVTIGGIALTFVLARAAVDYAALEMYLRNNTVAVREHFNRGAGYAIDDIAQLFGVRVDQHEAFVRGVYARRGRLVPLLASHRPIDAATTREFADIVFEAIVADAALVDLALAQTRMQWTNARL